METKIRGWLTERFRRRAPGLGPGMEQLVRRVEILTNCRIQYLGDAGEADRG